jgi:hypothetical protein
MTGDHASIADRFDRADASSLGTTPSGESWRELRGGWSIVDREAASTQPSRHDTSIAIVDAGHAEGVVQATVIVPQGGTGIAFRCRDADNCWFIEAAVGYGTWNVSKVLDGKRSDLGNVGIASTDPGTTVSVRMVDDRLTFFVNGRRVRQITDADLAGEQGVGLSVHAGQFASGSRWSEFLFGPVEAS